MPKERIPQANNSQDVYHDIEEVAWKYVVANAYRKALALLEENNLLDDPVLHQLHIRIVDAFNGNHNKKIFNERLVVIQKQLTLRLRDLGHEDISTSLREVTKRTRKSTVEVLRTLGKVGSEDVPSEQSDVWDGIIHIAGQDIEQFSEESNYFKATLLLTGESDSDFLHQAESSYQEGLSFSTEEIALLQKAKGLDWEMPEVISSLLIYLQTTGKYKSTQEIEFNSSLSFNENRARKLKAVKEMYCLMGKLTSAIAYVARDVSIPECSPQPFEDPIAFFLDRAGYSPTPSQIGAVKKIALAHSSHGLNSGELTARLAGSVRTTFPRALIASINIRSGILHSGAIRECMHQTALYLNGVKNPDTYISEVQGRGEKIYGFGHRIHKTGITDPVEMLGKDPRVDLYIKATQDGFPEKSNLIERLILYAQAVRKARPSLGANTDFGATVLFHALNLSPKVAEGFFTAFRLSGVCAQVVNELSIKGNSRRPPFPEVLPYKTS